VGAVICVGAVVLIGLLVPEHAASRRINNRSTDFIINHLHLVNKKPQMISARQDHSW
jgi:hypothetical protein